MDLRMEPLGMGIPKCIGQKQMLKAAQILFKRDDHNVKRKTRESVGKPGEKKCFRYEEVINCEKLGIAYGLTRREDFGKLDKSI